MRLLLVNWMDPSHPRAGGAERHLAEIFGRLTDRHRMTLVTSSYPGAPRVSRVGGLEVIRVGRTYTFPFLAPLVVRRLLARRRFDLLVEDLNKVPLRLPRAPVPTLVLAHHLWGRVAFAAASLPVALAVWLAERSLSRRYAGATFAAVSDSTARELIARGVDPGSVRVIENAAEAPGAVVPRSATPFFVYVGRLQRYKRVGQVIEAAAILEREGHDFRVAIAGQGPGAGSLRRLARRLGATRVDFLGSVGDRERDELLGRAWANVLMSRKEGWGLTVLEASRMGTPSVVAHAPGLWDAVRHFEDGLWVPYHHLRTLADALRYLILNPEGVERLGAAARRRAAARTWDRAAEEMDGLLRASAGAADR